MKFINMFKNTQGGAVDVFVEWFGRAREAGLAEEIGHVP